MILEKLRLEMIYITVYTIYRRKVIYMMTAKIFENGRSQAVRLPKEFRFSTDEVNINRIGEMVVLTPITSKWDSFMMAVELFSDDFMCEGRGSQDIQERERL